MADSIFDDGTSICLNCGGSGSILRREEVTTTGDSPRHGAYREGCRTCGGTGRVPTYRSARIAH